MIQYNIKLFKNVLIIIIILLSTLIVSLWLYEPALSTENSKSNQKIDSAASASEIHKATKDDNSVANANHSVDFDFYNLLSKPNTDKIEKNSTQQNNVQNVKNQTIPSVEHQSTIVQSNTLSHQSITTPVALVNRGRYALQIAALHDATAAVQFKQRLDTLDYPVFIQTYQLQQQLWYRVMVGPYADETIAQTMQQQLKNKKINSFLVTLTK